MSQLDLALEAEISTRHLSFLETGRSSPSREMLIRLSEQLQIPLRERNLLLTAAGFAPVYEERSLDDPALEAARKAIDLLLTGHEPFPALAVDRHWTLLASNRAVAPMLAGVDPALLTPPINVLRLSLHPAGLAPRIENLTEWRVHLLTRLHRQIEASADPVLSDLYTELKSFPLPDETPTTRTLEEDPYAGVAVPFRYRTQHGTLSFLSTTTIFGTPVDITLSEIALESFFPADEFTSAAISQR